MNDQDRAARIAELSDQNKVVLYCQKHQYYGPPKSGDVTVKPTLGCARCMFVYYFHDLMNTPPSLRAERLELMEETTRHMAEELAKGHTFGLERHAKVEYN